MQLRNYFIKTFIWRLSKADKKEKKIPSQLPGLLYTFNMVVIPAPRPPALLRYDCQIKLVYTSITQCEFLKRWMM